MSAPDSGPVHATARDLLEFWFQDARDGMEALQRRGKAWFSSDPEFDREIAARFGDTLELAATGGLDSWRDTPRDRLALVILLDQFTRNLHRGSAAAFLHDAHALELCEDAISIGQDTALLRIERVFLYMPMQHAEDLDVQERSVQRFSALADEAPENERAYYRNTADFAVEHRDIVARFGRFPHRNRVLGRESTAEEASYLAEGAPSFGQ